MAATLAALAEITGATLDGDADYEITHVADAALAASAKTANPQSLIYIGSVKAAESLKHSNAGAIILPADCHTSFVGNRLYHQNPRAAFALAAVKLHPFEPVFQDMHASAQIGENVDIASGVSIGANTIVQNGVAIAAGCNIGANCFIGANVSIGANTRIDHNVSIYAEVKIGANCELSSGVVIGADGFGFEWYEDRWIKIPQLGGVAIADKVSIGANTTIDCGAIRDTVIETGVVIDNQVQIGHNVRVGKHTVICGCTAIAGSSIIGERCRLGGRVSIVDHVELADDVHVLATSVVTRSLLKAGVYSSTLSAQPVNVWRKTLARLHRLEPLARKVALLVKNR